MEQKEKRIFLKYRRNIEKIMDESESIHRNGMKKAVNPEHFILKLLFFIWYNRVKNKLEVVLWLLE